MLRAGRNNAPAARLPFTPCWEPFDDAEEAEFIGQGGKVKGGRVRVAPGHSKKVVARNDSLKERKD
ncbi:hypothetical protein E2C01_071236 [Portunus trituberculatus]|uniref:Uncharacterized protein n=1 Tax=Portunus trituberculatus TaxID=210409 RepID=A0A5B7I7P0_PORTR|nr:hypothetical protein [Portunus trituberculatus]